MMPEINCFTCANSDWFFSLEPCKSCGAFRNWEPKKEREFILTLIEDTKKKEQKI